MIGIYYLEGGVNSDAGVKEDRQGMEMVEGMERCLRQNREVALI